MTEKITIENWKETIEDGLFDWNKTESVGNFIQSLIDSNVKKDEYFQVKVDSLATLHKASETQLDALGKMAVGVSHLQNEIEKLNQDKKILESRNDSLIGLLKSIPCSLNADGSYNKKVIKSFIQDGIAAKRKSGIYEVRFNGATSNVWLRWCENNKHFEAYGTTQKYHDKDMSYVAEKMSYDTEPKHF